jgi:N utilization substance protein B
MQTSTDPRHVLRQQYVQILFQWDYRHHDVQNEYVRRLVEKIEEIDATIQKHAPMWKIDEMAKIDVAILRLSVWELTHEKETPKKTVIDEAVELAKEFGNEKAPAFINGVLGRIYDFEIQKPITA